MYWRLRVMKGLEERRSRVWVKRWLIWLLRGLGKGLMVMKWGL